VTDGSDSSVDLSLRSASRAAREGAESKSGGGGGVDNPIHSSPEPLNYSQILWPRSGEGDTHESGGWARVAAGRELILPNG